MKVLVKANLHERRVEGMDMLYRRTFARFNMSEDRECNAHEVAGIGF